MGSSSAFVRKLQEWYSSHGDDLKLPVYFNKKEVDLEALWNAVQQHGGSAQVCKNKRWAAIGRQLDPYATNSTTSYLLKKLYERNLLPYERMVSPSTAMSPESDTPGGSAVGSGGGGGLKRRSPYIDNGDDDEDMPGASRSVRGRYKKRGPQNQYHHTSTHPSPFQGGPASSYLPSDSQTPYIKSEDGRRAGEVSKGGGSKGGASNREDYSRPVRSKASKRIWGQALLRDGLMDGASSGGLGCDEATSDRDHRQDEEEGRVVTSQGGASQDEDYEDGDEEEKEASAWIDGPSTGIMRGHLIGRKIRMRWTDNRYYQGTVMHYDDQKDLYNIEYEDGWNDDVDLNPLTWELWDEDGDAMAIQQLRALRDVMGAPAGGGERGQARGSMDDLKKKESDPVELSPEPWDLPPPSGTGPSIAEKLASWVGLLPGAGPCPWSTLGDRDAGGQEAKVAGRESEGDMDDDGPGEGTSDVVDTGVEVPLKMEGLPGAPRSPPPGATPYPGALPLSLPGLVPPCVPPGLPPSFAVSSALGGGGVPSQLMLQAQVHQAQDTIANLEGQMKRMCEMYKNRVNKLKRELSDSAETIRDLQAQLRAAQAAAEENRHCFSLLLEVVRPVETANGTTSKYSD